MQLRRKTRRRYEILGQARFLTFSCFQRMQLLGTARIRDAFVEQLALTKKRKAFLLHGWVVMPDHVHLLLTPPLPNVTVAGILSALKRPFAARVLRHWREAGAPILSRLVDSEGIARFWQVGGGYDRNIESGGEYREKLNYMHNNPIARGLTSSATDWRWSSARWYDGVRDGEVEIDPLP